MSRALQMRSQPQAILQAVASYKCSNEAVSTRKKYPSASPESTQSIKKTHLLTCDGIACSRLVSLTSLGLISAHLCKKHCSPPSEVSLQKTPALFAHQCSLLPACWCTAFFTYCFLQAAFVRSSPTHLVLCVHFTYPDFMHPLWTLVCFQTPLHTCCSPPSLPTQLLWFSWAWLHDFMCLKISFMWIGVIHSYVHCALLIIFIGLFTVNWRTYQLSSS